MIKITNGNLFFRKYHALHDINLKIKKGERVGLIGHNGAGKSTLIDVILDIKKLKTGSVEYQLPKGKSIKEISGVQFQSKDFPPGLKANDLLKFYLEIYNKKISDKEVKELIDSFGLGSKLNVPLKNMSGGQKQKISILLAFLNHPKLLILDEVMTGLDVTSQNLVLNSVVSMIKKDKDLTLISVSHNAKELELMVDRLIILEKGKIINDVKVSQLKKEYGSVNKFLETLKVNDE